MALTREQLTGFTPRHDTLVGIDSDGCVFDTMEVKQKQFMHPNAVEWWGLQSIAELFRETAEFATLYSTGRGAHRFPGLVHTFELLARRPEARASGVRLPPLESLRAYVHSGRPMSEASLAEEVERTGDPELARLLEWSRSIDAAMKAHMPDIPPFDGAREALRKIRTHSDSIVLSQTAEKTLARDWKKHGLAEFVDLIAGPEHGKKNEVLRMVSEGRYAPGRILVMGDAPGDLSAAEDIGALFYPIFPGREPESWKSFTDEAYDRFLNGTYTRDYQQQLIDEFIATLPETPPWE